MANELYIYTTPAQSAVQLTLDDGRIIGGVGPQTANGRSDAHCVSLPANLTSTQGGVLKITSQGKQTFENRGLVIPSQDGAAQFLLDDVHLADAPVQPPPQPVYPTGTPEQIIQQVYHQGGFNLATKEGCGTFTEACCDALHASDPMWGHIKKNPGQNQWNGHAVDALMLLAGDACGIYDIIHDSESPNATPSYNYKGEPSPELWYYPATATSAKARGRSPAR